VRDSRVTASIEEGAMEERIKITYKGIGHEIACSYREGSGESIVFIHGLGCSRESFQDVWDFPVYEKYTMLAFDLPGFGDSARPGDFSYALAEQAEICKLVIARFGCEWINLVAHSMGGAIALLLIGKIPAKVISFISLEGNLTGAECRFTREAITYSFADFKKGLFPDYKARFRDNEVMIGTSVHTNRLYYGWLTRTDPWAHYRSSASMVEWCDSERLLEMFKALDKRKCYIFGEAHRDLAVIERLGDIPRIEISDSGHFMMADNPREFYQKLLRFLAGPS